MATCANECSVQLHVDPITCSHQPSRGMPSAAFMLVRAPDGICIVCHMGTQTAKRHRI